MPIIEASDQDREFMRAAYDEAKTGYDEGGLPIGAVMTEGGRIIGRSSTKRSHPVARLLSCS